MLCHGYICLCIGAGSGNFRYHWAFKSFRFLVCEVALLSIQYCKMFEKKMKLHAGKMDAKKHAVILVLSVMNSLVTSDLKDQ